MKPLHVGLLVVGAAIAGGLAVKLTQPVPVPPPQAVTAPPQVDPPPVVPETTVETAPAAQVTTPAPPPVYKPTKPSPVRNVPPIAPTPAPTPEAIATPPPYTAPEAPATGTHPVEDPGPAMPPARLPAVTMPRNSPRMVSLRTGTEIPVRLIETLASDKVRTGDRFQATLAQPLVTDGLVIAERGARVWGRVVTASVAGKFQGVSRLELAVESFESSDGQRVPVSTTPWVKQAESPRNGEAMKVGGGAALGAIIGAIAGGGKGAVIGAGAGGVAGAGAVALGQPKTVTVPTETVIYFRLTAPVTITEKL